MQAYLWTMFAIGVLGLFARVHFLAKGKYPREVDSRTDGLALVVDVGFLVWVAVIIAMQ